MESRLKKQTEINANRTSLESIIKFLQNEHINHEKEYFYFEIDPKINPITAHEVQEMLTLPFEVALTEKNGKIVIETGPDILPGIGREYSQRRDNSRLSIHTHPFPRRGKLPTNTLSFSDVITSGFAKENAPLVVAMPSGLMYYQAPKLNPFNGEAFTGDPRDLMLMYGRKYSIDFFGWDNTIKSFTDLSQKEKIDFQRKFIQETGMIIKEVLWGDLENLKPLLDIINLKVFR